MPVWLIGWLALAADLASLGALLGAARGVIRARLNSDDVRHGAVACLLLWVPLAIGGLLGNFNPWAFVQWTAPPLLVALGTLLYRALLPEPNRRKAVAWAVGSAGVTAVVEIVLVVDALCLHLLFAVAGVCLTLPLAALAERTSFRNSWPAWMHSDAAPSAQGSVVPRTRSTWPRWLRPWTIPAAGAGAGAMTAFELVLEGSDAIALGLELWPLALGSVAAVAPLIRGRYHQAWLLAGVLWRRDPKLIGYVWRGLGRSASEHTPESMALAALLGVGLGAMFGPGTWGLGLALVATAAALGTRINPSLRTPERMSRERTLLRGWMHLASFVMCLILDVRVIGIYRQTGEIQPPVAIFLFGATLMFGISATYHIYPGTPEWVERWGRVDHSTIFVFVTACMYAVAPPTRLARWLLVGVTIGALGGILIKFAWRRTPRWVLVVLYLTLGWSAAALFPELPGPALAIAGLALPKAGLLMLLGGLFVTSGAIVYAKQKPNPWKDVFGFHEIFHLTTIVASALIFAAIWFYLLPAQA